jgi:hypothetical protein
MPEHYTLSTVEASAWCNKCGKNTPHRVAGRKLSYCIPCFDKLGETEPKLAPATQRQSELFEGMR